MSSQEKGRPERLEMRSSIEFIADFDIVEARGVNISAGGICFHVGQPLEFHMRFEQDGEGQTRHAQLAWMEDDGTGGCRLGFRFVPDGPAVDDD